MKSWFTNMYKVYCYNYVQNHDQHPFYENFIRYLIMPISRSNFSTKISMKLTKIIFTLVINQYTCSSQFYISFKISFRNLIFFHCRLGDQDYSIMPILLNSIFKFSITKNILKLAKWTQKIWQEIPKPILFTKDINFLHVYLWIIWK